MKGARLRPIRLLAAISVLVTMVPAVARAEPARSADAFVDSFGVNIHLGYTDTLYWQFDAVVKPKLLALGVRHVRDGALTGPTIDATHPFYVRAKQLAAAGLRFSLITSMDTSYGKATDYTQLRSVYAWLDGAVDDFEGINEPDLQTIPGGGPDTWIGVTQAAQKKLWDTVKGDPSLAKVAVLGPSITSLNGALGKIGDLSPWVDDGNGHPYPGGFCPACGTFYGMSVDTFAPDEAKVFGTRPMVMTETGYTNAIGAGPGGNRPVSEKAAAKYLPRLLFEFFNRGIVRTYPYEFLDEKPDPARADIEQNFGLVRNDGSVKPAYVAVARLIALLADPGPDFTPTPLDLTITAPKEVHHTLLQTRDGTYVLVLWNEVNSWDTGWRAGPPSTEDTALRKDLDPAPVDVVVGGVGGFSSVRTHAMADDGTFPVAPATVTGGSVKLRVRDAITIVELFHDTSPASDGGPLDAGHDAASSDAGRDVGHDAASLDAASLDPDADGGAPAAGGDAPGASQGGCGCTTAPAAPAARALLLSLLGLALVFARRARSRSPHAD